MSQYAHPEVLIDTQWLASRLNDPQVRVVEVDTSSEPCNSTHIPGAVFWNIFTDLLEPNLSMNLDPSAIEKLLSRSGIANDTTVVAYSNSPGTGAWIFWLLKLFGHEDVRVLNGEHQKWLAENRPVSAELANFPLAEYHAQPVDGSLRVLREEVMSAIGKSDRVLLDVRSLQEYSGDTSSMKLPAGMERAGHISSSVHLEFIETLNEDGTFKSFEQLQELYRSKGITPDKQIFPYCAIGARSSHTWFVLKYLLGYPNVRNYDGSWNQWSRIPDASVEK